MTYTINGKEYSEFDINKRCAEIMKVQHQIEQPDTVHPYIYSELLNKELDYCTDPADTDTIIDKCWNELMAIQDEFYCLTKWESIISIYNCTKLIAACICLIEMKEGT
jgi:hypothetical protein